MPVNTALGDAVASHTQPGAENAPVPVVSAPGGDGLTGKQRDFARAYCDHGNASRAYRECYDVTGMSPATVKRHAYRLAHTPEIATLVRAMQATAAEGTVIDLRTRMVELHSLATADASEIVRIVHECCRGCYAEAGHPWQWRDEAELTRAVERYQTAAVGPKPIPMPDPRGGFGFRATRDPNPDCQHCDGHGVERVSITPSDEWSPAARRLFKAARQKADGSIEIELESRQAASEQLARLAGWNIERSESKSLNVTMSAAEAAEIAARPVDEIVRLLFPRKGAPA